MLCALCASASDSPVPDRDNRRLFPSVATTSPSIANLPQRCKSLRASESRRLRVKSWLFYFEPSATQNLKSSGFPVG